MRKLFLAIFLVSISLISCLSTTATNSSTGSYNSGTSNTTPTVSSVPRSTETDIVFTYSGPQGVNATLYYNGQSIGSIEPGRTVRKSIPNNDNNFQLRALITGNDSKEFRLAARGSATINVNIVARRSPSGIIITDFDVVDRIPVYSVRYVSADGLNVRAGLSANDAILDVISKDCRVEILEEYANGWVRIKYYGSRTGCVNSTYLTATQPAFVVTSLKVGNVNSNGTWLTNAGNILYSSQMRYFKPVVTYNATYTGKETLYIKIFNPDGVLDRNAAVSPSGFTFSNEYQINRGNNQILNLSGWGNNDRSTYQAGEWTVEIWHKNKCVWSEKITIRP